MISINDNNIPATLTQPADGRKWGGVIGKCAGETFETSQKAQFVNNERCKNPANWMK
jgi:hypothetical protein